MTSGALETSVRHLSSDSSRAASVFLRSVTSREISMAAVAVPSCQRGPRLDAYQTTSPFGRLTAASYRVLVPVEKTCMSAASTMCRCSGTTSSQMDRPSTSCGANLDSGGRRLTNSILPWLSTVEIMSGALVTSERQRSSDSSRACSTALRPVISRAITRAATIWPSCQIGPTCVAYQTSAPLGRLTATSCTMLSPVSKTRSSTAFAVSCCSGYAISRALCPKTPCSVSPDLGLT